ncbi:helix-turn-helix domain-containing protein [Streptomyces humi]
MNQTGGSRAGIRDFPVSRRARRTPERAGLPGGSRRRVPGLRCEEAATLAAVSTEWYTRLEKGHLGGVSENVPHAVARAPRLDEDERPYLFDLARAAQPAGRTPRRRKTVDLPPGGGRRPPAWGWPSTSRPGWPSASRPGCSGCWTP